LTLSIQVFIYNDIYLLAKQRLQKCGVTAIYGGDLCTYSDSEQFFSYRRDGQTGRMASLIWLET
jgi:copper oxidase (laccase) domain-containing protein